MMNLLSAFCKQSSLKSCDLIFYGIGCCDMTSKCKAVQSIGTKAIQDQPGPVFIGRFWESTNQTGTIQSKIYTWMKVQQHFLHLTRNKWELYKKI